MSVKKTHEQFICEANIKHNNKYGYPDEYKGSNFKIFVECPIDNHIFVVSPKKHLEGRGCSKCANRNKTTTEYINEVNIVHNFKYRYLDEYSGNKKKINIICPIHGPFKQRAIDHLCGSGCRICVKHERTPDMFVDDSNIIHVNKYEYPEEYINIRTNINIKCPIHGLFPQTPSNHLQGRGCPSCKKSIGELEIENILTNKNIKFDKQKMYFNCYYKNNLKFDFYLPELNMCIEFDGEQHFKSIKYWGGDDGLFERQERDKIKNEYCKNNNIKLLRIRYNENIEEKLKENNII